MTNEEEKFTLSYPAEEYDIECEYCKKNMHFYETQLRGTGKGDGYSGYEVVYTCEHCGKENKWQGAH